MHSLNTLPPVTQAMITSIVKKDFRHCSNFDAYLCARRIRDSQSIRDMVAALKQTWLGFKLGDLWDITYKIDYSNGNTFIPLTNKLRVVRIPEKKAVVRASQKGKQYQYLGHIIMKYRNLIEKLKKKNEILPLKFAKNVPSC